MTPGKGIWIGGEEYLRFPPATLEKFSVELDLVLFDDKSPLSQTLRKLLAHPADFVREFQPLSIEEQDTSRQEGTRSLKGTLRSYPNTIIVLSGCGVVKEEKESKLTVEPPHWHESLDMFVDMGQLQVAADGSLWGSTNTSVLGAYSTESLFKKIHNTQQFSQRVNQNNNLQLLLAGTHTDHNQHGWMIYALPTQALRPNVLQDLDLMTRSETDQPGIFGKYIELLFHRIQSMHEADISGIAHLQLHPGNCYAYLGDDGVSDVIITDWTTSQKITKLPSTESLQKAGYYKIFNPFEQLSPQQAVKALDLTTAFRSAQMLLHGTTRSPHLRKNFGVDVLSMAATNDTIDLELTYFSIAILAYQEKQITESALRATKQVLKNLITNTIYPMILNEPGYELTKSDWMAVSGNVGRMDRPGNLVEPAFHILAMHIASFLVSGKTTFNISPNILRSYEDPKKTKINFAQKIIGKLQKILTKDR